MGDEKPHPLPSLAARGMTVGYSPERPVIRDLSFGLEGAGIVRLDAPNGAGKSTLVEAASGYLRPSGGRILVNGRDAHELSARARRRVCRAVPSLHPHLSLVDHLSLSADLAGVDREEPLSRARRLGLDEWFGSRTASLSTGTARRLWYVICTTGRFDVALLDEPFNGVDQESSRQMVAEMNEWARRSLIVLASHTVPEGLRIDGRLTLPGSRERAE